MSRQRFLLPAMVLLTLARCLLLPLSGLSVVEQHALECSRDPGWWHAGMGPVIPLVVKATTFLLGEGGLGVRFFSPWLMLAAGWILWELARGLFDATTASWTLLLFQVTPAVNMAATTMTTTTFGLAGAIGTLAALRLALRRTHRRHLYWWLVGLTLTVLFFADWRFSVLGLSICACLLLTPRGRRALMKWPVLPILAGSLLPAFAVFWMWNARHGWPALAPLPDERTFSWTGTGLHLLVAFSPLMLLALGWVLLRSALRPGMTCNTAFLYAFMWPLVTLDAFCWSSLPWPGSGMGAWLAPACMLLAHDSLTYEPASPRVKVWARTLLVAGAAVQVCWLVRGLPLASLGS